MHGAPLVGVEEVFPARAGMNRWVRRDQRDYAGDRLVSAYDRTPRWHADSELMAFLASL